MSARHRHQPTTPTWQRIATGSLYAVACGVVFAVVAIGVGVGTHRLRVEAIESNSMRPVFARGTAVFLTPEHLDQVQVGQIISYVPPKPFPQVNVVHRVYSIKWIGAAAIEVQTKGDANKAPDPWQTVISGGVWHLKAPVPYLGELPLIFGNPVALIGIVLVALSVIAVALIPSGADDAQPAARPVAHLVAPRPVPDLLVTPAPFDPSVRRPSPTPVPATSNTQEPDGVDEDGPISIFSLLGH